MSKARIGMVTIGQAPRGDVVPDMAALLPDVEILEAGGARRPGPRGHRAPGARGRRRDPRHAARGRLVGLRRQVPRAAAGEGTHRGPRGSGRRAHGPALHGRVPEDGRAAAAARAAASPARGAARALPSRAARRADAVRAARAADDGALARRRLRRGGGAALALRGARSGLARRARRRRCARRRPASS